MTRTAPILRPADLAADLARHAREAKRRLAGHDMSAVEPLQKAMEQTLGLHFEGDEGAAFFRSSLVQTLFYGLFSGWMLWRQTRRNGDRFDWRGASEYLALPLIGDLYEEIARPRRLADLGLREPLEWATASLNRVVEEEFFQRFQTEHAITLFYEPFLQAFDPQLRKELGVWYTPPEIVQYMVGRVDQLLRCELGIADGLADEQVFVLDPAAGTGSYLVEVARRIHQTLTEQGHGSLAAARVKRALKTRIFGFEILPAPYVVAHLQLGVFLRSLGASLTARERFEVFLTNALTGWEPPKEPKSHLLFPELEEEAERATTVKRSQPILVILGNPPYNRFAGVAEDEEADLIEPYKSGLYEKWRVRKQLLDDLYIRFFRLAEKRISEVGGRGIVCYISNYSWLEGLSHPVMRERLAAGFDLVLIDNCNGDKFKTGKRTPDGRPDESMFTTDEHSVGIQIGTAIATLVKRGPRGAKEPAGAEIFYRNLWGTGNEKRAMLIRSLASPAAESPEYVTFSARAATRWAFANGSPGQSEASGSWPKLAGLFPVHYSGLNENRGGALISDDPEILETRMKAYLNPNTTDEQIAEMCPTLMQDAARFNARETRRTLLRGGATFNATQLVPLAYRPFDDRRVYWIGRTKLLNEKREDFFKQVWRGNLFLSASQIGRKGGINTPTIVDKFGDLHLQDPWSQFFPLSIRINGQLGGQRVEPNIDPKTLETLCGCYRVRAYEKDRHTWTSRALEIAKNVFFHALAITWSPAYRRENEAALRQDWPRVPIPAQRGLLAESARLGHLVAELLLPDRSVRGVTCGSIRPELRPLGVPSKVGGGNIDPNADLKVEATWGFLGAKNAVMCGKGKTLPSAADPQGALDVYLNDRVYWANVPLDVWTMTIGGYPVIKKWLSYREFRVLGRPLLQEEMTYIAEVMRRLKALLLLGDALDANYRAVAETAMAFGRSS